eukprot:2798818-Karenia_brevis.AAC.1
MNNGDLWHIFYSILRDRGAQSCAFTWTKGHALHPDNAKYLQQYPALRYQAVHNDKADTFAEAAHHQLHNQNIIILSDLL